MESLQKAHSLFLSDDFAESIPFYESASKAPETASEALTSLCNVYLKLGNLPLALSTAELAIHSAPTSHLPYLRKAQALFYNQNFSSAQELFLHANNLKPSSCTSWLKKCESELSHSITKDPYTWFQSNDSVYLIFFAKTSSPDDVKLEISPNSVEIKAKTISGSEFISNVKLFRPVDVEASTFEVKSNKIEVVLKKAAVENWQDLEPIKVVESRPSYPSSSKKHVNWDKLDKEIEDELKKEKPEGEAALNELFKQIYANSDEDTRRAMIKSYQTSGGTVLSTNWGEVNSKDYEGKDRPEPPKGQEWAKPN